MSMISIQNRQKRLWIIPAVFGSNNQPVFKSVPVEPGTSALVDEQHWDQVAKGNKVIEALVGMRSLVVTRSGKVREDIQDAEELANPVSPAAPADLTEKDDRVHVESKVELKEVDLKDDAPTQGKGKK
jgi:hypothetical protein